MDDDSAREYMKYFATKKCESEKMKHIHELVKAFRDKGVAMDIIVDSTGLTPEEIKAL